MPKKKTQKKATTLTAEEAAKLVKKTKDDELELNHITELGDGAAEALAEFEGSLHLNGLQTLSDKAAETLSKWKCGLSLDGLKTLSEKTAEALAKFKGNTLHLDGLKTLSDKAAKALGKFEGICLSLDGLKTLSDKAAEALAEPGVSNFLFLNGLKTLSGKTAEALAKFEGEELCLEGLKTLSDKAAEALGAFKGELILKDLIKKKVEAAKKAAKKKAAKKKTANPIEGMKFVITGKLPSMGRAEAMEIIEDNGGKVVTSPFSIEELCAKDAHLKGHWLTRHADYLLIGKKHVPTALVRNLSFSFSITRHQFPHASAVKIITEQKLLKMLLQ